MSSPPTTLLKLSKVTKKFGVVTAVSNVDLTVHRGDFIAIFGPNGAGKTTLLRLIASLCHPSSGELVSSMDGSPLSRTHVGYVSHQTLLYNEMTGLENLLFYAQLYGLSDPDGLALKALERMNLRSVAETLVRNYSRGMKQRLTLARALLHDPQLLLLDEPYTGLDQHGSRLLTGLLRELSHQGRTVLLITHNLGEGLELCNRVVVQHRGRIVFEAPRSRVHGSEFEDLYFRLVEN